MVPVNGKTPELKPEMPIRYAAYTAFNYFYRNMILNEKGTLIDNDPESLHYFRVSSKRLRVALSVFRPYLNQTQINYFKDEIKTLAPILGSPRDIDVYLEFLTEEVLPEISADERKSLKKYIEFFKESRRNLRRPVMEKINSARYRNFKRRFEVLLAKGLSGCRNSSSSGIAKFAEREINSGVKSLLRTARLLLRRSSDKRLHRFRIECRKMRYRTELFLSLLGDDGKKTARILVEIQNALGGWHDSVTACEKLDHFLELHPQFRRSSSIRNLRKIQKHRIGRFKRKFFRKLKEIRKIRKFV